MSKEEVLKGTGMQIKTELKKKIKKEQLDRKDSGYQVQTKRPDKKGKARGHGQNHKQVVIYHPMTKKFKQKSRSFSNIVKR